MPPFDFDLSAKIFSDGDLALKRYISHYYCRDRKISGKEARRIAEKWGNW